MVVELRKFAPSAKIPGDLIKSEDWNAATKEIERLEKDKLNREGADSLQGPLTIREALGVGVTDTNNLTAKLQVEGDAIVSGNVGIGTTTPQSKLTINSFVHAYNFPFGNAQLTIFEPDDNGGRTLKETRDILNLVRSGKSGEAHANKVSLAIGRYEHSGVASRTQLDIKLTDGSFDQHNAVMSLRADGNVGIGLPPIGTGQISSSSTTVTGVDTKFVTQLRPGDLITATYSVNGTSYTQTRKITAITNATQLTTDTAFNPAIPAGTAFTVLRPVLSVNGASQLGGTVNHGTAPVLSVAPGTIQFDAPNPDPSKGSIAGGRLTIDGATGNVGIGLGTETLGAKLHVAGEIGKAEVGTAEIIRLLRPLNMEGGTPKKNSTSAGLFLGTFEGVAAGRARLDFRLSGTPVDGNKFGREPNVNVMTLQADGNVGIGIANPSTKLDVSGDIKASGSVSAASLTISGATTLTGNITAAGFGTTDGNISTTNGKIGIGIANPDAKLHIINQSTDTSGKTLILGSTAASQTYLSLGYTANYGWIQSFNLKPLALNSAGNNVGIGTIDPKAKLQVSGATATTSGTSEIVRLLRPAAGTGTSDKKANAAGLFLGTFEAAATGKTRLDFKLSDTGETPNVTVMTLQADGNVGVGLGNETLGAKLHVAGEVGKAEIGTAEIIRLLRPLNMNGQLTVKQSTSAGLFLGTFEGGVAGRARLDFKLSGTPTNDNVAGRIPDVTVMTLQADGNVGIGITDPKTKLQVSGATATTSGTSEIVRLLRPAAGTGTNDKKANAAGLCLGTFEATATGKTRLDFKLSGAPASGNSNGETPDVTVMTLQADGNVGIGTTTPSTKLQVSGVLATTNVETSEFIRLLRPAVPNTKNNNSAGLFLGSFESGITGRARLDFKLSGVPGTSNNWGGIPDVSVMTLQADGNVGIGITDPKAKLQVSGATATTSGTSEIVRLLRPAAGTDTNAKQANAAGLFLGTFEAAATGKTRLDFKLSDTGETPNVTVMTLQADGKVGIGLGGESLGAKLHVAGEVGKAEIGTAEIIRLLRPLNMNGQLTVKQSTSAGLFLGTFEGVAAGKARLDFKLSGTPTNDNGAGRIPDVTVMTLQADGNVGIGVDKPSAKLDVSGDIKATGSVSAESLSITGNSNTTFSGSISAAGFSTPSGNISTTSGNISTTNGTISAASLSITGTTTFSSSVSAAGLTVTGTGNAIVNGGSVGIGTNSPTSSLEIRKDISGSGPILTLSNNSAGTGAIDFKSWNVASSSPIARIMFSDNYDPNNQSSPIVFYTNETTNGVRRLQERLRIHATGGVKVTGAIECTNLVQSSSRELKTNIADLSQAEAMQVLAELNPVKFHYKDDPLKPRLGFIAEELPELLAGDRKSVSISDLVAILTKVVQTQQILITQLAEKVNQ